MGLDQYLSRKVYLGLSYEHNKKENTKSKIVINNKEYPTKDLQELVYRVGYWRKCNQIHKFFVEKVQENNDDCKEYYVDKEVIKELYDICIKIKEKAILVDGSIENGYSFKDGETTPIIEKGKVISNAEEIAELLPTQSGFFFGDTNYDEYYMQDIEETIEILTPLLDCKDDIYYKSSW